MQQTHTGFPARRRLTTVPLAAVALATLRDRQAHLNAKPLVVSDARRQTADPALRVGDGAARARDTLAAPARAPTGQGRPKPDAVALEVTLLPAHRDGLAAQPGRASITSRSFVHEAHRSGRERGRIRQAQDRADHAMSTLVGNRAGVEVTSPTAANLRARCERTVLRCSGP